MKRKKKFKFQNIILILFIIIFIFSLTKIITFYYDLNKSDKENKKIIKAVFNEKNSKELIDFKKLRSINSDVKGWILFNENKINYPIVQTDNNDYYLKKTFEKEDNQSGSIFMDYRNTSFNDKNVVLFGHAMLNGSMFGSLKDAFKDSFYEKEDNKIIKIINEENEILKYQIFSYYIIDKEDYYITTSFDTDSSFEEFINTILKRSYKNFNINITTNDNILTLSTCSGTGNTSKRRVIHAKKIK